MKDHIGTRFVKISCAAPSGVWENFTRITSNPQGRRVIATKAGVWALVTVMALAGCVGLTPAPTQPARETLTVALASPTPSPEASPTPSPEPAALPTSISTPQALPTSTNSQTYPAPVLLARADLAAKLNIQIEQVEVSSYTAQDWPDACLGVSRAGGVCAAVITPGFQVNLAVNGMQYQYRTDESGKILKLADGPTPST
jgi:hypothetical protein